jgi:hypothetical protein
MAGEQNLRFQELRDEVVMAERRPPHGRHGPPSSAPLLRWHIGWKKGNRLIESGSWIFP